MTGARELRPGRRCVQNARMYIVGYIYGAHGSDIKLLRQQKLSI